MHGASGSKEAKVQTDGMTFIHRPENDYLTNYLQNSTYKSLFF